MVGVSNKSYNMLVASKRVMVRGAALRRRVYPIDSIDSLNPVE